MGPPGNLWVTMSPKPTLTTQRFTNWYNNIHGSDRLALPFIKTGRRYRAVDGNTPEYLATYEITDMDLLNSPPYLSLREHPSAEEQDILPQIDISRFLYAQEISMGETNSTDKVPYLLMTLRITVPLDDEAMQKDIHAWYVDEHIPMLAKIPGWLRSRRYKVIDTAPESALDGHGKVHWFATHEYTKENGIGGKEYNDARQTVWRMKIMANAMHVSWRSYELFYEFGSLPRDLAAKGVFAPHAVIEGEFALSGSSGEKARYRLEGSTDPNAPLIVFSNSFVTNWHIWDEYVRAFRAVHPQFRYVRYNQRSYAALKTKAAKSEEITIDVLAADVAALLDGLMVQKAHAIVGVSLGGATALSFALKYPERVSRFIAADFGATSPPSAAGAWAGRAMLAEKKGMHALGEQNIARWFLPKNKNSKGAEEVLKMVAENDLEAFKMGTNALAKLDLEKEISKCEVKGLFVAGLCDSMIPLAMQKYPALMKKAPGSGFEAVPDAGHLPMVENPVGFLEKTASFLGC